MSSSWEPQMSTHKKGLDKQVPPIFLTFRSFLFLLCMTFFAPNAWSVDAVQEDARLSKQGFEQLIETLPNTKLKGLSNLIDQLSGVQDERLLGMLESMLSGELFFLKSDKRVVMVVDKGKEGKVYKVKGILDSGFEESVPKKSVKKIRVNNKIRKQLRKVIATLTLFSKDRTQRIDAVNNLMGDLNSQNVALLEQARAQEQVAKIKKQIELALTIASLDSDDLTQRQSAVKLLAGELHPVVRNRLESLLEKDSQGHYIEDKTLVDLAKYSLDKIDGRLKFYGFLERLFFGLSLGSILLLAAIGLSITFGVMGVINMAHGELLMLGAYTTYVIQLLMPDHIGLSIFVAIPAAFIVCALVGIAIERGVIRFLKGRPLETLLATFGISLVLQQTVRSVFSPLNRQVSTPEWMSGALQINPGLALTYNRLYILLFALIVFAILLLIMKRTSLGLYVRAVSQNRDMARAVGIRSEWVDAMTFGLGSGIAGVAGVALSQMTNVGPNLGQSYIIDSFMVVVFGGVGNLWGTLVGAFSLGVTSKFLEPLTGTVLAQIIVLVFIVLFIQKRPRGLFPQQGRSAES